MVIQTKEVYEIIKEVWNKLYFNSYGAYRDGIDEMKDELEEKVREFEEIEGTRISREKGE